MHLFLQEKQVTQSLEKNREEGTMSRKKIVIVKPSRAVRTATCDTTYDICQFSYNISYPTDENKGGNEGNPSMSNMIWRYNSK